jgi:uncharacterized protein (TIGR02611 family)
MERMKRAWKKVPVAVRKPLILVIGTVVVTGGVILLPLPGPGWVIIFFGFAILATEFAFAERLRDWMVKQVKGWIVYVRRAWQEKRLKPTKKP